MGRGTGTGSWPKSTRRSRGRAAPRRRPARAGRGPGTRQVAAGAAGLAGEPGRHRAHLVLGGAGHRACRRAAAVAVRQELRSPAHLFPRGRRYHRGVRAPRRFLGVAPSARASPTCSRSSSSSRRPSRPRGKSCPRTGYAKESLTWLCSRRTPHRARFHTIDHTFLPGPHGQDISQSHRRRVDRAADRRLFREPEPRRHRRPDRPVPRLRPPQRRRRRALGAPRLRAVVAHAGSRAGRRAPPRRGSPGGAQGGDRRCDDP